MASRRLLILLVSLIIAGTGLVLRNKAVARSFAENTNTLVTISTIAGGGFGSNVPVKQAPMVQPTWVAFDPVGRGFYLIDEVSGTSLVRFVNTSAGPVTLAGTTVLPKQINLIAGGGSLINSGISPRDFDLAQITGLAISPSGNILYLAMPSFSAITAINLGTQNITMYGRPIVAGRINDVANLGFADFRALSTHPTTGELYFIAGRVVYKLDDAGNPIAFAGGGNPTSGNGDGGTATEARLTTPMGLAFDNSNNLLIAEAGDARNIPGSVRRVNPSNVISSLATGLEFPTGITTAPNGDAFVALGNAQQIVRITPSGARTLVAGRAVFQSCDININPVCGDGGPATEATLSIPDSTARTTLTPAADSRGLYLPDFRYKRVRFVNLSGQQLNILDTIIAPQTINTIVGSGFSTPYDGKLATSAELFVPAGVAVDTLGNLFIADTGNNRLRFVNRTSGNVTLFANTDFATTVEPGQIVTLNKNTGEPPVDDRITTASFAYPQGLAMTPNGILLVDSQAGALIKIPPNSILGRRSGVVRFLNLSNQDVTFFPDNSAATVVVPPGQIKDIAGVRSPNNPQSLGDGLPANAVAFYPTDVALDSLGNIYIADQGNNRIRRIEASNGIVSTFYGDGSPTTLNGASGIAIDNSGKLHIADTRNNRILRQNAPGDASFSIIANNTNGINRPRDLVIDSTGTIFITNALTHQVLDLVAPDNSLGVTSVVAGNGTTGFSGDDGAGPQARLSLPNPGTAPNDIQYTTNIANLSNGDLVFTDTNNNRIRLLKRNTSVLPLASVSAASYVGSELASETITAAFGNRLATTTLPAPSIPLPTTLGGTTVSVTDSGGTVRLAPLFFVSPAQINYQIPPGTLNGPTTILVTSGDGTVSAGTVNIAQVAPGLFTADSSGRGIAAALILRIRESGEQIYEEVSRFDPGQNRYVHVPIDLGPPSDQVFLILFGTGYKFRNSLSSVITSIGGESSEVLFAGPVDGFVGLDQTNARISPSLAGRGVVDVVLVVDGKPSNTTTVQIR